MYGSIAVLAESYSFRGIFDISKELLGFLNKLVEKYPNDIQLKIQTLSSGVIYCIEAGENKKGKELSEQLKPLLVDVEIQQPVRFTVK